MEQISKFTLPEVTEDLFLTEAKSSVALTKEVASKINELVEAYNELSETRYDLLNEHTATIRQGIVYMKDNLANTIAELFTTMNNAGEIQSILDSIFTTEYIDSINKLKLDISAIQEPLDILKENSVSVKEFGAIGDGITDDTLAIQKAIDHASTRNKIVYIPAGDYLISKTIYIKGVSLIGSPVNHLTFKGAIIRCKTKDFVALKQETVDDSEAVFNLHNILILNANIGFEVNRAIHSKFEHLVTNNCNLGIKLGDTDKPGCEHCIFDNIIVENCSKGIVASANAILNHNKFINSYINGHEVCLEMYGVQNNTYGAMHNIFDNVTFKSDSGRGAVLRTCRDITFSNCLFETGANAIKVALYSTINLVNCSFKGFKKINTFNDINVMYVESGVSLNIDNGLIFLDTEYENVNFFDSNVEGVYNNIYVTKEIIRHGSYVPTTFKFFKEPVKTITYTEV